MEGSPPPPSPLGADEEVQLSCACALWKGRMRVPVPGTFWMSDSRLIFRASLGEESREIALTSLSSFEAQPGSLGTSWLMLRTATKGEEEEQETALGMKAARAAETVSLLRRRREELTRQNLIVSEREAPSSPVSSDTSTPSSSTSSSSSSSSSEPSPVVFRLPAGEMVLERSDVRFYVPLQRVYRSGTLFVFHNFVAFHSDNLVFVVPLCAVSFVLPAKTMMLFGNAINMITNSASFFFVVNKDRDALLLRLIKAWKTARAKDDVSPYPVITPRTTTVLSKAATNQMQIALLNGYTAEWGLGATMMRSYPQLRYLCQSGIPDSLRAVFWQSCSGSLLKRVVEGDSYHKLLEESARMSSQATIDIEKDVRRSLPEHPFFQTEEGVVALRNVLRCYSFRNPIVGYTQGMNLLAAHLLLFMGEEDAFYLLCSVIEDLNPNVYRRSLVGALVEQQIFESLFRKLYPKLALHMDTMHFDLSISTTSWWLCLFIGVLNFDCCLTVLDAFFEEGSSVLLRVGLAVVQLNEEALFMARDVSDFVQVFGSQKTLSAHEIFKLVNQISIPHGMLEMKREVHTFEESKRLAEKAKKNEMNALAKLFPRFTWYELENIYDCAVGYMQGGVVALEFLQFQRIVPNFFAGLDLETMLKLFTHCRNKESGGSKPSETGVSLKGLVGLLDLLAKASLAEQFDFFWTVFAAEEESEELRKKDKMSAAKFCSFVTCVVAVRFSLRTLRVVFHKSNQSVASFCATMVGRDAAISRAECRSELVENQRLETYFRHHS